MLPERTGQQLKTTKHFQSAAELKELIQAAQRDDAVAIEALCIAFRPLILKEANRSYIIQTLGEDAVNTAWEIFLDYIRGYDKKSYLRLPGLLKAHIYYALLHKCQRKKSVGNTATLDQADEKGKPILEASDSNKLMDDYHLKIHLNDALNKITLKQKDIIEATFLYGYTLDEYAKQNHISLTAAYTLQKRALLALKEVLA